MYFPVSLNVKGRPCLVVGGGRVAFQKASILRRAGAVVRLVSPRFDRATRGWIVRKRTFRDSDVKGARLVIAATNDPEINARVARACARLRILVNVVDRPELCDFISASIVRRGPLLVSISTNGTAPGLSKSLRKDLEKFWTPDISRLVKLIGSARRRIRERETDAASRMRLGRRISSTELIKLWRRKGLRAVEAELRRRTGGR
jgi:siroheme synthase-like protein